ncbi:hypothetical protein SCP_0201740 [Sparassis crispa]|uniref:Uncharacterized protein n=1 Tax=Sparassis crispa TaxID=139825 RepID=A0A401GA01_9APHY|nr:hypothetical protein SCP_0201740 [Sparassis crispa]GBE78977.1 hypothetical protein SCP_0201740 [Sparassis crispa]
MLRRSKSLRRRADNVDTETEDDEDDAELQDEVTSDPAVSVHRPKMSSNIQKRGKDRAASPQADDSEVRAADNWLKTPGPLSKEAREQAAELGENILKMAANIGRKYGKSTRDILVHAGLSFKPSRAANPANIYRRWYSRKHPKMKDVSSTDYLKMIDVAYKKLFKNVDPDDEDGWEAVIKSIHVMCDDREFDDANVRPTSMKSITARMMSAKDQFTDLAASYRNLADMEVIGAILYVGTDTAGRQTSAIFGGSPAVKKLIEDNGLDVRTFLDFLTTSLKSSHFSLEGFNLPTKFGHSIVVEAKVKENPRDRYRRIFTGMMQETLQQYDPTVVRVHWMNWLKIASRHSLCIVDWPACIPAPGPDFNYKNLKTNELKMLTEGYIEERLHGHTNLKIPQIVKWHEDDMELSVLDPRHALIPLVIDAEGTRLRLVRDAKDSLKVPGCLATKPELDSNSESEEEEEDQEALPPPPSPPPLQSKHSKSKSAGTKAPSATKVGGTNQVHKRRRELDINEDVQSDEVQEVIPVVRDIRGATTRLPLQHAASPHGHVAPRSRRQYEDELEGYSSADSVHAGINNRAATRYQGQLPKRHAAPLPKREAHRSDSHTRGIRPPSVIPPSRLPSGNAPSTGYSRGYSPTIGYVPRASNSIGGHARDYSPAAGFPPRLASHAHRSQLQRAGHSQPLAVPSHQDLSIQEDENHHYHYQAHTRGAGQQDFVRRADNVIEEEDEFVDEGRMPQQSMHAGRATLGRTFTNAVAGPSGKYSHHHAEAGPSYIDYAPDDVGALFDDPVYYDE